MRVRSLPKLAISQLIHIVSAKWLISPTPIEKYHCVSLRPILDVGISSDLLSNEVATGIGSTCSPGAGVENGRNIKKHHQPRARRAASSVLVSAICWKQSFAVPTMNLLTPCVAPRPPRAIRGFLTPRYFQWITFNNGRGSSLPECTMIAPSSISACPPELRMSPNGCCRTPTVRPY
jgi:hypothetical protein